MIKKKIKTLNPKCKFLLGSNYPSVNLNFHNLKRKVKERKKIKKILVFFGSIDPTGETFKALSVLKKIPNIKFDSRPLEINAETYYKITELLE